MSVKLHPDAQAMKELIVELGFKCEDIMRSDGPAFAVQTEFGVVHVKRAYGFLMATDRIPGVPMEYVGHGDLRMQINI
jgi:hypothetical protein